jgi:hypothetical protein
MKVLTTREIRSEMKTYFELADTERIVVKRGKKYINLLVSDVPDDVFVDMIWVKEFFSIPEEYRCNPFEISPSGDLFWADRRNVEQLKSETSNTGKKSLEKAEQKKFLGLE